MKNIKNAILIFIIILSAQLRGAERPPQPPVGKKLPTFGQMIEQEEERQKEEAITKALESSSQSALARIRKISPASLQGLPADIQRHLLKLLISEPLNMRALAETIFALSGTSKALHAAMNEPRTLVAIFNVLPYTANAIDLAERLQRKPNTLPGMQGPEIKVWLKNAKESLVGGEKLFAAVERRNRDIIYELLTENNLDLNWKNPREIGHTALQHAASRRDIETTRILLSAGANPDSINYLGYPPLMNVNIALGHEIVELLLQAGANPNIQSPHGETALMRSAEKGGVYIVSQLLKGGANPHLKNNKGETARDLALQQYEEICYMLQHYKVGYLRAGEEDLYLQIIKLLEDAMKLQKNKMDKK